MPRTNTAVHQVFTQYFCNFLDFWHIPATHLDSSNCIFDIALGNRSMSAPSKQSVESLSRRSLDQERLLREQFSFLPFSYIIYCFCNKGWSSVILVDNNLFNLWFPTASTSLPDYFLPKSENATFSTASLSLDTCQDSRSLSLSAWLPTFPVDAWSWVLCVSRDGKSRSPSTVLSVLEELPKACVTGGRPNIRTIPVRRGRTSHSLCGVGGQLFETKRVAEPDRLSTARSQGGGFFSGFLAVFTIRKIWRKMKRSG